MAKFPRRLGSITVIAAAYFAAVIVALHFVRTDLDPLDTPTSAYAVGEYGGLMTSAFVALSLGTVALIAGLHLGVSDAARSRVGLFFLGMWGTGLLVAASFPIDLEGQPETMHGTVHRLSGPLSFLSLTTAVLLTSRSFKRDEKWRSFHPVARLLSLALLALFLLGGVLIASESGFGGLGQRVLLIVLVSWFIATGTRLRNVEKTGSSFTKAQKAA